MMNTLNDTLGATVVNQDAAIRLIATRLAQGNDDRYADLVDYITAALRDGAYAHISTVAECSSFADDVLFILEDSSHFDAADRDVEIVECSFGMCDALVNLGDDGFALVEGIRTDGDLPEDLCTRILVDDDSPLHNWVTADTLEQSELRSIAGDICSCMDSDELAEAKKKAEELAS